MSGIGGNEPTGYNYTAADTLKQRAESLATLLEGQASSRSSLVSKALEEFRGYYSEVFESNAEIASRGRLELASSLRSLAGFVQELRDAAEAEDQRREAARAWAERQRQREEDWFSGAIHEIGTFLRLVEDDPMPPAAEPAPNRTAQTVTVEGREIPAPVGGSSTSSAVPADLRSFQTGTQDLDAELGSPFRNFDGALTDYIMMCNGRWGNLDAQSLVVALREWFEANSQDAEWAGEVAGAFEAAGGEGVITVADASISAALASAGVDVHRDDFTIGPFTAIGSPPTTGFADDPVNTATGNFLEPEVDLRFAGAAASFEFTRMYNTQDTRVGVFGLGWSSLLEIRLEVDDEGASFVLADGRQIEFPRVGTGWDRGIGENFWLNEVDAAEFHTDLGATTGRLLVVTNNTGGWWAFTRAGAWLGRGNGPGTAIRVFRDDAGNITRLLHERGRWLDVEYNGDRVVRIHASDGRRVEYLYDDANRLTGVTDAVGTRTYRWNDAGLIDQVVAADGTVEAENFYDANQRVIRQLTPYGRSVRYAYLRGRVTSVSTDDGTGANTWIADRKGRVIGIIDAEGNRQSMAYDAHGNIVSTTARDGQVTVHAYDARGRKIRTVTPEGADITYGYDDHDRVTTVVTASGGVVEYEYATETDRSPSIIIDPAGGRTQLTWDNGLLQQVVDPEGVTLRYSYDERGDLIGVTNAAGDTAQTIRDHAGRVTQAITPSGARTIYRYDARGLLISREDPDGAIWRYEHGAGGHVTAIIDPLGARTEFEYGPTGELTTTIDALGRAITKDFDEFGNVASLTLPDGAQWGFTHDALSRLREVIDPAGGVWGREYDLNGQLAATVDPTGIRAEVTRARADGIATIRNAFEETTVDSDEFGRPIRVEKTDGTQELVTYDACGRPVELVDANGGLTLIQRDLAGRITAITTPAGRTTHYEYDACGRPVTAIDAVGERTTLVYDADSRVIQRFNPVGGPTTLDYDVTGRVIGECTPGVGASRYRYDKVGRLVAVQDSWSGQRRFRYDAAGQLIQAINGVGGITRYEYDIRGRVTKIIDPTGGVTVRTYTQLDKVDSSTDPLGRMTTATYDPAGRQISQTDPDGNVTEWTHDEAGRETGMKVNGRWVAQLDRDERARTNVIRDFTHDDGETTHVLTYSRLGQLIERATTGPTATQTTRWEYDADGARTALIDTDGARIEYHRDILGRITQLTHPTLGEINVAYNAAGRIIEARTGDQLQTWEYNHGYPVVHTLTDSSGVTVTRITRDMDGRITQIDGPEGVTSYTYDDACQLIETYGPTGGYAWTYDLGGRLIHEYNARGPRMLDYDAAGQLVTVTEPDGSVTAYAYDGQGRRIQATSEQNTVHYTWDARGWLAKITNDDAEPTNLWVNALGELTEVNDTAIQWDLAASTPTTIGIDDTPVFKAPGGLTGVGQQWETATWRSARATDVNDPWQVLATASQTETDLPSGIGLTSDGGIEVAGLEWMGARAYDPAARGFLSVDPLAPITGSGWTANPYSYAGNDPLHSVDPLGLSPVSDADLQSYADGLQGPLASGFSAAWDWTKNAAGSAWDWTKNNWEYLAGGAAIVAGGVLMVTGVGGPAGMMLIAAGADTVIQKATTGDVNWGQVAISGAFGGLGGAGLASIAGRQMAGNAVEGAVESVAYAASGGQPLTPAGLISTAAEGAVVSTATAGTLNRIPVSTARLDDALPAPTTADRITSPLWSETGKRTSVENAYEHYKKHGAEFPHLNNALEYVAEAQEFGRRSPEGILTVTRQNGDTVLFDPATERFGVMNGDGVPRTYFVPDPSRHGYPTNLDYFNAQ